MAGRDHCHTPNTLLRWHRQLIARKWTYTRCSPRRGVLAEIRRLVVRRAEETPHGATPRIQGTLRNLGYRVGRSTITRILKMQGLPPVPERPISWQKFLRAHKDAIAGPDFFSTEAWTWRGLVRVYTVFVIHLASRRVQILASTPHPDDAFLREVGRTLTMEDATTGRVLICDRDAKWSGPPRVSGRGRNPNRPDTVSPPNANAHAEWFVRSIKEDASNESFCWASVIFGERYANTSRTTISNGIIH